jgi:tetratricopeptide (TPR) repeat protein
MLETIRSYALRQLTATGGEEDARRRHALAMLALAETAMPHLPSAAQARWLDRLAQDHANLGSALRWAVDAGAVDVAQRLSWATWRYWQLAGHLREGRNLAEAVVAMPRADEPSPGRMWSLAAAGGLAYWQADTARASALYHAQLETAGQIGDRTGEADAFYNLAATESIFDDREEGARYLQLAREAYRELGDEIGFARTDWAMANLEMLSGRLEEALAMVTDSRRQYARSGDAMYEALACGSIAFINQLLGNRGAAVAAGIEAIQLSFAMRDVATTTVTMADGAILLIEAGRPDAAATVLGAYHALCDLHGVQPPAGIGALILESGVDERAMAALSSEQHAAAARRGAAMSLDEAVAFLVAALRESVGGSAGAERPQSRSE